MTKQLQPLVSVYPTVTELKEAAAELFATAAKAAMAAGQKFRVALAGGPTPQQFYELLATPPYCNTINWLQVEVYWGDERFVPHSHPDRNYLMAKRAFLDKVAIPTANIYPMPTVPLTPEEAAATYEATIRRNFGLTGEQLPQFDLFLLGIGTDGHTASLFPGTAALHVKDRLVVANYIPQLAAWRLTLTLPVINNAAQVVFLVAGAGKADILKKLLTDNTLTYPAQLVRPVNGRLYYLIDTAANKYCSY